MAEKLLPDYIYECSLGHWMASPKPMETCVAARCKGELKRVGPGSRTAAK
jgi:hypothetical protein